MSAAAASTALEEIRRFVSDDLLPHEELEDRTIYPMLAAAMGSDDATASMHRTHQEIFRLRAAARSPGPRPAAGRPERR